MNETSKIKPESHRLYFLDGLRGLAVAIVLLFHVFNWNNAILKFNSSISEFFIFKTGWLGAELFFMISGFVILMTLERSTNLKNFLLKRFMRLYPAMLVSVVVLLISYAIFTEGRYFSNYNFFDLLSSLTLTEPYLWNIGMYYSKTNVVVRGLNASFWTLFIEIRFYLLFGFVYFKLGKLKALYALIAWFLISVAINPSAISVEPLRIIFKLTSGLYFGWFALGASMYLYHKERDRTMLIISIAMAFILTLTLGQMSDHTVGADYTMAILLILIFMGSVLFDNLRNPLNHPIIQFLGFISYPLYLIHEPVLIPAIYSIKLRYPAIPQVWISLALIVAVIVISYLIAKWCEPSLTKWFKRHIDTTH